MADEHASGGAGGVSGSSVQGGLVLPRAIEFQGQHTRTFMKTHRFLSFGIAPVVLSRTVVLPATKVFYLTTALAEIPVWSPQLYMTWGEFSQLYPGERAVHLEVSVIQRNVRVAFETNTSTSTLATLNQNKNGAVAVGLNKNPWLINANYGFAAATPMVPNAVRSPITDFASPFYATTSSGTVQGTIPCSLTGTPMVLPNYAVISDNEFNVAAVGPAPGWPDLTAHIHQYDAADFVGKEIVKYEYKPKQGVLREWPQFRYYGPNYNSMTVQTGNAKQAQQRIQLQATSLTRDVNYSEINTNVGYTQSYNYYDPIEKCQQLRQVEEHDNERAQLQPSLHCGVLAVPSLTTTTTSTGVPSQWTDVQSYYEVTAKMVTKWSWRSQYAGSAFQGFRESEAPIVVGSDAVNPFSATRLGLHTDQSVTYMP